MTTIMDSLTLKKPLALLMQLIVNGDSDKVNDYKDGTLKSVIMSVGIIISIWIGFAIYFVN